MDRSKLFCSLLNSEVCSINSLEIIFNSYFFSFNSCFKSFNSLSNLIYSQSVSPSSATMTNDKNHWLDCHFCSVSRRFYRSALSIVTVIFAVYSTVHRWFLIPIFCSNYYFLIRIKLFALNLCVGNWYYSAKHCLVSIDFILSSICQSLSLIHYHYCHRDWTHSSHHWSLPRTRQRLTAPAWIYAIYSLRNRYSIQSDF